LKPERNGPCGCGSGRKYKKCCGQGAPAAAARPAAGLRSDPSPEQLAQLVALAQAGRHPELEARTRELLAELPDSGLLWKLRGLSEWLQGKDALPSLQRASELLPGDAEGHGNLGNALRAAGRLAEAAASQRRALELKPDYAQAHNDLGSALLDLGRVEEAIASFRRAAALEPDFALAHSNLGNALLLHGRPDEAEASCRRALQINPRLTAAMVQIAEIQAARGRFDEAQRTLQAAICIEPDMPEAWSALARLRTMTAADAPWLDQAQRIAAQPLPARREVPLRYALGKYFDDVGDYPRAFENYRRANELSGARPTEQDMRRLGEGVDRIMRHHTRDWLARSRAGSNASPLPVFVVGMPRSGTTLVEQILASHAQVHGAGELDFWSKAAAAQGQIGDEPRAVAKLAEEYLALLTSRCAGAHRIVDKMPGNFMYLGLINAALPGARIIHMRRDPLDTCLSIYFHDFGRAHPYAGDLNDLAAYYAEYSRLMDHWRATLPANAIMDLPYEALVRDQETWSRKMIEFIGLPWDEDCLAFHRTSRTVSTHSKWQARQKISASSVGRWRNYQAFLAPLLALRNLQDGAGAAAPRG
jgi:tetratricopeptide (TPR) repeat protein